MLIFLHGVSGLDAAKFPISSLINDSDILVPYNDNNVETNLMDPLGRRSKKRECIEIITVSLIKTTKP